MKKQTRSLKSTTKQSARLGAYLAAGIGAAAATAPTADAAIVLIDIGPSGFNIGGVNGGVAPGAFATRADFPFSGQGDLFVFNSYYFAYSSATYTGLGGSGGLQFATAGSYANPAKFASNAPIGGSASWVSYPALSIFQFGTSGGTITSPDFGPNSFMGFQTAAGNYGWLEVTWTSKTSQFQILSGAYESVPGVAILAGDTGTAAVPEPSTWAMSALLAGGVAFTVWRKRRQQALKEAA